MSLKLSRTISDDLNSDSKKGTHPHSLHTRSPEATVLLSHPSCRPPGLSGPCYPSDESEPHSLHICRPCLSKPLSGISLSAHLLHLGRAGVDQSWWLVKPAGRPPTYANLLPYAPPRARPGAFDRDRHRPRPCPQPGREARCETINN